MIWHSSVILSLQGTYRCVMKQVSGRAALPPGHGTPVATPLPSRPGSGACFKLSTSSHSRLGAGRRPTPKPGGNDVHRLKPRNVNRKGSIHQQEGSGWQNFWCSIPTHPQFHPTVAPLSCHQSPKPCICSSQAYRAEAGFCWPTTWGERLKGFGRRWWFESKLEKPVVTLSSRSKLDSWVQIHLWIRNWTFTKPCVFPFLNLKSPKVRHTKSLHLCWVLGFNKSFLRGFCTLLTNLISFCLPKKGWDQRNVQIFA